MKHSGSLFYLFLLNLFSIFRACSDGEICQRERFDGFSSTHSYNKPSTTEKTKIGKRFEKRWDTLEAHISFFYNYSVFYHKVLKYILRDVDIT